MAEARPILTAAEMRAAERRAIDSGTSVDTLMERAGTAIFEVVWRVAGNVETLILCGPGNNGGDGYVAARLLAARGVPVRIAASEPPKTDAARQAASRWTGPVGLLGEATKAPVLIDALFGTGLTRPLEPGAEAALDRLCAGAQRRIAVDLPSGISTDDGRLLGAVPQFDLTIALGALKPAHRLLPAAAHCGRVVVADIGIDVAVQAQIVEVAQPKLVGPTHDSHKYNRGKLLVVGGAMPGAAHLAALSAQRAGPGYVELVGVAETLPPYALVRSPWSNRVLEDDRIGAIVIGPGLGRERDARARLDAAFACGKPLVIDADALTLIGKARHNRLAGHILTPHWGEFVRLFGDSEQDRLTQTRAAAAASGAIVHLKGADSIVAHPDGRAAIAPLAPPWLASAGTGDVLAGIVGGLLASGHEAFAAVQAALWLHAEAARMAGPMLTADDLITYLPAAAAACL